MSHHLPAAQIFAVQLVSNGSCEQHTQCLGKVTVKWPYCTCLHAHRVFSNDTIEFTRTAPCSTETDVRRYRVNLNARVPKREVSQSHPVHAVGEGRDDNAFNEIEHNWTE